MGTMHTTMVSLIGIDHLPLGLSWLGLCTGLTRILGNMAIGGYGCLGPYFIPSLTV